MNYKDHLQKDPKFSEVLINSETFSLQVRENIFAYLCASILSQQLSTKVAGIIHDRFLNLFGGAEPNPVQVRNLKKEQLRSIGLSNAKAEYTLNVAEFAIDQGLTLKQLQSKTDGEVVAYVTQIKGVGQWTAEMLLMFALGREDVFPGGDLGIRQAMTKLYQLNPADPGKLVSDMHRIASKWAPFRTYACMHLWRWKDQK